MAAVLLLGSRRYYKDFKEAVSKVLRMVGTSDRNWRQGDLCYVATESSATLSLAVIQKVENEANELDGPAKEISKQSA